MPKFMKNINTVSRCITLFRADRVQDCELSPYHHGYIFALCRDPGVPQDRLAQELCINKSNVTRTLATLEEQGFVERRHSETDKRVILVYPTEKMLAILPAVKKIANEWNEYLSADLTEEERELFQKTLEKISARAQTYIDSGTTPTV